MIISKKYKKSAYLLGVNWQDNGRFAPQTHNNTEILPNSWFLNYMLLGQYWFVIQGIRLSVEIIGASPPDRDRKLCKNASGRTVCSGS